MKAAYYETYGTPDVVAVADVPKPLPKQDEILVKVMAVSVTAADARFRAAQFPKGFGMLARLLSGVARPRNNILGSCFSGVVEALGDSVDTMSVGDEVCGMTGMALGAHAEFLTVKVSKAIAKKPENVSHEDAAGVLFGGTAALYFLRDRAGVREGDKVAINGASGAVGTHAVQLARHFGATVTGVTSGDTIELVKSLGASDTIDYTQEALLDRQEQYDVILDTVGNIPISSGKRLLAEKGRLVLMVASLGQILASQFDKQVCTGSAPERKEDIELLLSLLADKKLSVVKDKIYSLDNITAAHAHVSSGHTKGVTIVKTAK